MSIPDKNQFITIESGHNELTPQVMRNTILGIEQAMLNVPEQYKIGLETMHNFIDNIYTRTVFMKAGSLFTGKIHKKEHISIVSCGLASVVSEEWGSKQVKGPAIFVSPPLVKRLLFIHEDMIWTTIHPNPSNTRDISILEDELILATYDDLNEVST